MVTIILPVSRRNHLRKIFSQLEVTKCNRHEVNILTYVDGDYPLFVEARNLTVASKFNQRLSIFRNKGIPNVGSIYRRRQRIADIHNELKEFITKQNDEYVILLEDDTLMPTDGIEKLLSHIRGSVNTALVSGVQIGRWGYSHIGAWKANDIYDTTQIESIPAGEGLQKVEGTGLYCAVMRKSIYLNHNFEPFGKALGPDFNLGIQLTREGYGVYVDHSLKCDHLTPKESIGFHNSKIQIVELKKLENGRWSQGLKE
jgi:hypothetical protein